MTDYYPIEAEFYQNLLLNEGSSAGISNQRFLPQHTNAHDFKLRSLDSDNYLTEVVATIDEMMMVLMQKIPLTYNSSVGTSVGKTFSTFDGRTWSQYGSLTDKDTCKASTNPSNYSIYSALVHLTVSQLYSNSLTELLQKKADIAGSIKRWQKLRKCLLDLSMFIERVLQRYINQVGNCPEIKELTMIQHGIDSLVSKANDDDIKVMFQDGVSVSEFHLLTAALGLNGDVASALYEIRKGSYNHQTDQYHITDIVCKAVEDNHNEFDPVTEVIDILIASGFSSARASTLAEKLQNDELSPLQSLMYWVEWYFDSMFENDIFLTAGYPLFPCKENELSKWFEIPVTRNLYKKSADEMNESYFSVQVCKTDDGLEAIKRDGACYPPKNVEESIWYHATDHESAKDIMLDGIILKNGCKRQDFSHNYGLYLTKSVSHAEKWAKSKGGLNRGAVIVFKHNIDATKYKGLDLRLDKYHETWCQVVKYYSSGKRSRLFKCPSSLVKELWESDYIEGPMCGNKTRCELPGWQPIKKDDSHQLCIKSQELANELSSKIDGIIFISRSSNFPQQ